MRRRVSPSENIETTSRSARGCKNTLSACRVSQVSLTQTPKQLPRETPASRRSSAGRCLVVEGKREVAYAASRKISVRRWLLEASARILMTCHFRSSDGGQSITPSWRRKTRSRYLSSARAISRRRTANRCLQATSSEKDSAGLSDAIWPGLVAIAALSAARADRHLN